MNFFSGRTWVRSVLILTIGAFWGALTVVAQEPAPGYNSTWKNADGSPKLALEFGGGLNTSAGSTRHYEETGWNYRMGGGYNFSRRLGVLLEYSFDHAAIPKALLIGSIYGATSGDVHLWSFTAEPIVHYFNRGHVGGYVVGGGGFYRKTSIIYGGVSSLVCDETVEPCITANIDLKNSAGGANFGTGLEWRPSDDSNVKFFLEARYVWVDNQPVSGYTIYPPANYRTGYFPATAGLRW